MHEHRHVRAYFHHKGILLSHHTALAGSPAKPDCGCTSSVSGSAGICVLVQKGRARGSAPVHDERPHKRGHFRWGGRHLQAQPGCRVSAHLPPVHGALTWDAPASRAAVRQTGSTPGRRYCRWPTPARAPPASAPPAPVVGGPPGLPPGPLPAQRGGVCCERAHGRLCVCFVSIMRITW